MKKCRRIAVLLLLGLLCLSTISVYAEQPEEESITVRKKKAEQLGLAEWVDDEGYLLESFYEGKSDHDLSEMGLDGLVRTWTQEELDAYVQNLNAGIACYAVTYYQKVSQINPSTGKYLYTGIFEVDGILAYCMERSVSTPAKGSPTGAWQEVTNENVRKVLYYGYNGPAAQGFTYVETALATGEANGDGDNSLGRAVLAEIKTLASPPGNFHVWKVETNGGTTQDLAFYTIEQNGKGQVQKTSKRADMTDQNSCYSLQGAVYGIYGDAACTAEKGRVSTGTNGISGTIELPAGTYYVKEIASPKGYQLSAEVKPLVISAGNTTTVAMADDPQTISPDILVQKADAKTGQEEAQGKGSLAGAEFSVKYYKGEYGEGVDPAALGKTPDRQWVFQTDDTGKIRFQEEYLVSGDTLWTDASGKAVLPLGTVTIQERRASNGYRLNPQIFVRKIANSSSGLEIAKVAEPIIELELVKYRENTTEVMEGAVFEHVSPDGTVEQAETGTDGKIIFQGLLCGTHEIREVSPPVGYRENRNVITFLVNGEGVIHVTSRADETYGAVRTSFTEEGNLIIEVEDKVGYRLPETGSAGASALTVMGVLCCITAHQIKLKRKDEENE